MSVSDADPALENLLHREVSGCVRFFWECANTDPHSPGFGLVPDRVGSGDKHSSRFASVAAVGFGLSALAIGVMRDLLDPAAARERLRGTLATLERAPHWNGFWAHFLDMSTAERVNLSEFSTIDTGLALCGAMSAVQTLGDPESYERTEALLTRVRWDQMVTHRDGRSLLHMAFNNDPGGQYGEGADERGLISVWDMTAEQLCLYILAAGHPDISAGLARDLWHGFNRPLGHWGGPKFVHTPGGEAFTYLYSHAWFPFQRYRDDTGFDWFENSRQALLANRAWCIDNPRRFRTLGPHLWGLTAGDGLDDYIVSGAPVVEDGETLPYCEGTVMPYAIAASLPFLPAIVGESLLWLDREHPQIWGEYGLIDAINLEGEEPRYIRSVLGIDKGIALLMIDNYLHGTTWDAFESHPWVARSTARLGWSRIEPPAHGRQD